ncbi:polyprenyl diphosphate synthase [Paenibacillus sp. OV219]|uniref:polyprenyl diphosphate synthase n=1 Tax=Paenibacillus sp. OV219 TaxID=1884377 RepID=UPI0008C6F85E|nr:polyprenyl diphosphate synthase [Paenibacillus sp. OV219]SEN98263.1 Undecaprenyl pyrophosphate synthetase [Paenibacillus sp. OV219]
MLSFTKELKKRRLRHLINWDAIPKHVAIMMDGNGRWATRRGLPRTAGHFAGMKVMEDIIYVSHKLKLHYLTLYAFSTENWKRPAVEVEYIIGLINQFVTEINIHRFNENNIKVNFIGDISRFSEDTQQLMRSVIDSTNGNTGLTVNFAVNYGGRAEIIHATRAIVAKGTDNITIEEFGKYLHTVDCPSPELIIRTSGEKRLSGFLLWQAAQSELWFTDEMWPSFNEYLYYQAFYEYQQRKNRA